MGKTREAHNLNDYGCRDMQDILIIFLGAMALLFIARKIARRVGLVDKPGGRKQHKGTIPLVGGVSIYFSLWIMYLLQPGWLPDFSLYMLCASVLLVVGILDDRFDLPVLPRAGIQAGVAIVMVLSGLSLSSFGNILFGYPLMLGGLGWLMTVFAVIGAINAFNMVDGIDGLLGALSCVTFGSLSIVFLMGGNAELAMWCLGLMAACIPYILLNLGIPWGRKFKVFMGDAGSMLIGFTVIWLLILATQGEEAVMSPVTALWLIAVPLVDMLRVMVSRVLRGVSPFRADREHMHHILMRAGLSGRWTLLVMTSAQVFSAMTGIILDGCHVPDGWQLLLFLPASFFLLYGVGASYRIKLSFARLLTVK